MAKKVEEIVSSLSLDQAIAYLLCPEDRGYSESDWISIFQRVPLANVFGEKISVGLLESLAGCPVLIAADLEHGAGSHIQGCIDFPWPFAIGAADSIEMVEKMGASTAFEAKEHGVRWTFSPCVDLSYNHNNPVVNIRSLGDDPRRVSKLAGAWIQAMQGGGIAACAKHFPGDGMDDRDQHLCTSVNSLSMKKWWSTYGMVWRSVINAGVLSIMSGHISLPAFLSQREDTATCMPATLCTRLQNDLLRKRLGFRGVIVSDAAPMIGLTSRVKREDAVVANILAGSDVFLFADPIADFGRLKSAYKRGILTENRIMQSVDRIIRMRIQVGLYREQTIRKKLSVTKRQEINTYAVQLAEKSIILYRKSSVTPISLESGANLATVTLRYENGSPKFTSDLPYVKEELEARGFKVTQFVNPSHNDLHKIADEFDAVFVNFAIVPHALIGTVRLIGATIMSLWRAFWVEHSNVVFSSFGSPYHLYELPHLPNYWIIGSISDVSQRAAVRAWLGEIEPRGKCPVKMPV